jgi:organic hydroperoxide reductase OsmC/OhrA
MGNLVAFSKQMICTSPVRGDGREGEVDDDRVHRYEVTCSWSGSTGVAYEAYGRRHRATAPPAAVELALSSDPAFFGDARLLNPEQLLVLAAASCQLLSFLAVAARARLDVVAYEDRAGAVMPEATRPIRVTEITLRPRITVRAPATEDRVRRLVEVAHRECFIANSITSRVVIDPAVVVVGEAAAEGGA